VEACAEKERAPSRTPSRDEGSLFLIFEIIEYMLAVICFLINSPTWLWVTEGGIVSFWAFAQEVAMKRCGNGRQGRKARKRLKKTRREKSLTTPFLGFTSLPTMHPPPRRSLLPPLPTASRLSLSAPLAERFFSWYNILMSKFARGTIGLGICMVLVAAFALTAPGRQFLGSILSDSARFLALQKKADFDQNLRIDFQDFTVFAASYGQEAS
jgi:hypothetical protein